MESNTDVRRGSSLPIISSSQVVFPCDQLPASGQPTFVLVQIIYIAPPDFREGEGTLDFAFLQGIDILR